MGRFNFTKIYMLKLYLGSKIMNVQQFIEQEQLVNLCKKPYKDITLNNVISFIKLVNRLNYSNYIIKTNFINDNQSIYKSILTTMCYDFPQLNYQIPVNLSNFDLEQLIKINLYAIQINDNVSLILDNSYIYISNFNFTLGFHRHRRYLSSDITNEYYQLKNNYVNKLLIEYNKDQPDTYKFVIDKSIIKIFEPFMLINRFKIDKPSLLNNEELFGK